MSRAIMEAIAAGSVVTVVDVKRFVECTLLAATEDFQANTPVYRSPPMTHAKQSVVCYCKFSCKHLDCIMTDLYVGSGVE